MQHPSHHHVGVMGCIAQGAKSEAILILRDCSSAGATTKPNRKDANTWGSGEEKLWRAPVEEDAPEEGVNVKVPQGSC